MKKITKTVTTEDLAEMMTKGFQQQDKKFEDLEIKMDEKFEDFAQMVEKGFEGVDKRFESLQKDLNNLKEETSENFGKVRNDILNFDDRFVTRKEFHQFVMKVDNKKVPPSAEPFYLSYPQPVQSRTLNIFFIS